MTDELFRRRMHFKGPEGFLPCTRDWPHDGPCAHREKESFQKDFAVWIRSYNSVVNRFGEALPCQFEECGVFGHPLCRNCDLVMEAAGAISGPMPHEGDYRND